jgi:hypothetical protein
LRLPWSAAPTRESPVDADGRNHVAEATPAWWRGSEGAGGASMARTTPTRARGSQHDMARSLWSSRGHRAERATTAPRLPTTPMTRQPKPSHRQMTRPRRFGERSPGSHQQLTRLLPSRERDSAVQLPRGRRPRVARESPSKPSTRFARADQGATRANLSQSPLNRASTEQTPDGRPRTWAEGAAALPRHIPALARSACRGRVDDTLRPTHALATNAFPSRLRPCHPGPVAAQHVDQSSVSE